MRPSRPVLRAAFAVLGAGGALALGACKKPAAAPATISAVPVDRRTIVVDAQATGAVEPINVIEVKSKASGMITRMPVETGTQVRAGQLLVQVETRDVQNQFDQAEADLKSAQANYDVAVANMKRSEELYAQRVITTQEHENAQLALTQAQGQLVRARTNLDLARQRLEDATVFAPLAGTIIEKPVSEGQVIASATGSVTGGTTLLRMADLGKVRLRALVNETDIGSVRPGQAARVVVDAFPERPFQGTVEKIEPQAVVQQSVTMFPVIVSLENAEGLLKPGMNGEVSLLIERRENVLAVANDAVKTLREAPLAAALVGLSPDSVQAAIQAQQAALSGRNGRPAVDAPPARAVAADQPAGGAGGAREAGGSGGSSRAARGGAGGAGGPTLQAAQRNGGSSIRARTALVFVQTAAGTWEPRVVRLGAANYDYSEVLAGLNEGEQVASLAVASLQQRREQQNERFRTMTGGGGVPGMTPPAGGGRPGGGR
jgi:HlyD family secretion protein